MAIWRHGGGAALTGTIFPLLGAWGAWALQSGPLVIATGATLGTCAGVAWTWTAISRTRAGHLRDAERSRASARAAHEMKEVEALRGRQVLAGVPDPVLGLDAAGVVLTCNTAGASFFERPEGPVGKALDDLFTRPEVAALHQQAAGGKAASAEMRIQTRQGARTFLVNAAPAQDGSGGLATVLTLRDVTEQAAASQLKTDFVANASHELRTPLASIRAASETLLSGASEDPEARGRFIQMIAVNAQRLEEMVRDFLDLSRLESPDAPPQVGEVQLEDLSHALTDTFETALRERKLSLSFEIEPAAERLRTDARLLTLVLKNLIDNATKFAYEGSVVRVVAERHPVRRGDVRFRVIDRGIGIPIAQQQRVFERFYQVDAARAGTVQRRGTGLGLAIVKHAVRSLGGNIGVESVWKEGTTMTVDLPGTIAPLRTETAA